MWCNHRASQAPGPSCATVVASKAVSFIIDHKILITVSSYKQFFFFFFCSTQILFEATVKGISPRVLGSASYQVGKLDVLNVSTCLFRWTHLCMCVGFSSERPESCELVCILSPGNSCPVPHSPALKRRHARSLRWGQEVCWTFESSLCPAQRWNLISPIV